jgi:hypothetical protein
MEDENIERSYGEWSSSWRKSQNKSQILTSTNREIPMVFELRDDGKGEDDDGKQRNSNASFNP